MKLPFLYQVQSWQTPTFWETIASKGLLFLFCGRCFMFWHCNLIYFRRVGLLFLEKSAQHVTTLVGNFQVTPLFLWMCMIFCTHTSDSSFQQKAKSMCPLISTMALSAHNTFPKKLGVWVYLKRSPLYLMCSCQVTISSFQQQKKCVHSVFAFLYCSWLYEKKFLSN